MLSQRHTLSFISYWLGIWIGNDKKPHEINLDQTAALFGADVQRFTGLKSTNEYISVCMNSILYGTAVPDTLIRIDRFHFVRNIHEIKEF